MRPNKYAKFHQCHWTFAWKPIGICKIIIQSMARTSVNIYENRLKSVNICGDRWTSGGICENMRKSAKVWEHRWTSKNICENLRNSTKICEHQRKSMKSIGKPTNIDGKLKKSVEDQLKVGSGKAVTSSESGEASPSQAPDWVVCRQY